MSPQVPHRLIERAVLRFELDGRRAAPLPGPVRGLDTLLRASRAVPQWEGPSRQTPAPSAPAGRVITISRQLGSGGRRIAERLGEWLGWQVWDREILDMLASASSRQLQARLYEALDEKGRGDVEVVMAALFGQVSDFSYHYLLPKAILTIAQRDAIILGRAAHLFLPSALKVRVVAPDSVRESNLIRFDGLDPEVARRRMRESDREREAFRRAVARNVGRAHPSWLSEPEYHLVVDAALLGLEPAARLVLHAAQMRFGLPPASTDGGGAPPDDVAAGGATLRARVAV